MLHGKHKNVPSSLHCRNISLCWDSDLSCSDATALWGEHQQSHDFCKCIYTNTWLQQWPNTLQHLYRNCTSDRGMGCRKPCIGWIKQPYLNQEPVCIQHYRSLYVNTVDIPEHWCWSRYRKRMEFFCCMYYSPYMSSWDYLGVSFDLELSHAKLETAGNLVFKQKW